MDKRMNLTMLTDFYEITMANGYFESGMADDIAYFDMFFRRVPDGGGYAIMAGLEQLIDYLKNLRFTDADIAYLRSKNIFCEDFLAYLRDFEFKCDVWAVPEGTPIFPHEPIVTVRGPVMQAQFIETMVLLCINHQSMIATKASRIVRAAKGRPVMEFGSRRAHGADAAIMGARAAYIGGCSGTACAIADRDYGIVALGTMAHSWVQMYPDEYSAFKKYAEIYPDNCVCLLYTSSGAMDVAINETERRRGIQDAYNKAHGITPTTVRKSVRAVIEATRAAEPGMEDYKGKSPLELTKKELADYVKKLEKEMKQAAGDLQFERAAQLRDQIFEYKVRL